MKNLLMALAVLFFAAGVEAQEKEDPLFEFQVDFAVGIGTAVGEEGDSFSKDSLFAALHVDLLDIDLFESTAGVGIEFGFSGALGDSGLAEANYSVWSLNRANIPKTTAAYAGGDVKILQSDVWGLHGDLDFRLVVGYRFGKLGPGTVRGEGYFVEENRPISVAVLYDW